MRRQRSDRCRLFSILRLDGRITHHGLIFLFGTFVIALPVAAIGGQGGPYARSLFRENTELKAKVQKLEKENTAFKSANWNHTHEMVRLQMENRELKKDKSTLDALVGRIGNDVLQKLLSETPKEQPKHKEESL